MASSTHAGATAHRLKNLKPDVQLKKGGPVATRIAQLLADPALTLGDIANRVVKDVPDAKTTARSVASVASQLRRDGFRVPDRRHGNGHHGGAAAH
jgi:hypothetical protein